MFKSVATESKDSHESGEMNGKRGAGDEGIEDGEWFVKVPPAESLPTSKDDFMATDDFRRLIRQYVPVVELFRTYRLVSKPCQRIAEEIIDRDFESGVLKVLNERDFSDVSQKAFREKNAPATQVIFLLNVTHIGDFACHLAANLVFVEIPEGVVSIGKKAFSFCDNLTTVIFPKSLTSIDNSAFAVCINLDIVDLLHTNLQKLGDGAFCEYYELKSMKHPVRELISGTNIF
ncbi:hypothetical protein TrLO_g1617 [Triparma laevis f. longispina]|uniref:Uncharacterized protein n=1 Tax=Triparma laevis f. longispina TaxID=1714387 RepID=A0A9W7AGH5_9STRA|nr:hypothetical protein TrLO_g1617 [Triparma laevis f. longispina]